MLQCMSAQAAGPTTHNIRDDNILEAVDLWCRDNELANQKFGHIGDWNTSAVTSMRQLFHDRCDFNEDIGNWDVSGVADMCEMFYGATSFNQDIGTWDVSNVINMKGMFFEASSFNQNISAWRVSKVTDMSWLFRHATSFNHSIGRWDVSSVQNMTGALSGANRFNSDISNWDVSAVVSMNGMFFQGSSFNQDVSRWRVGQVRNMACMFFGAEAFNQHLGGWDVSSVGTMRSMFEGASAFNRDIRHWDVSNVRDMSKMFRSAISFDQDIGGWDVSRVMDMSDMFRGAAAFNRNLGGWSIVSDGRVNVAMMFFNARSLLRSLSSLGVTSFFHDRHIRMAPQQRELHFAKVFPWCRRRHYMMFLAHCGYLSCHRRRSEDAGHEPPGAAGSAVAREASAALCIPPQRFDVDTEISMSCDKKDDDASASVVHHCGGETATVTSAPLPGAAPCDLIFDVEDIVRYICGYL